MTATAKIGSPVDEVIETMARSWEWRAQAMIYKEQLRQQQRGFAKLHRKLDWHKRHEAELERLLGRAEKRIDELWQQLREEFSNDRP